MDIIHGLDIETTAEKLFEALSTDKGIAAWWTKAKTACQTVQFLARRRIDAAAVAICRGELRSPGVGAYTRR